ncbi:MAG: AAA family ATPase [Solobacterium sp.]|nr:AAA family ATPase [Solobacterium sp.]
MADRRRDEKERLWNEVLGRKRAYESDQASKEIELSIDAHEKEVKETLKSADYAMDELNRILLQQQKDLDALSNEMKKPSSIDISNMDMDQLEADIRRDYGTEEVKQTVKNFDSATVFDEIYNVITSKIMGQKDALRQMIIAFRRPYVMGEEKGMPKNVILISGPRGSGRHEAVMEMARSLSDKNVFASDEVYTIDMSRYTSGAQEQIFLQDLYEALQGKGSVICFEHFENGFPSFLRMVDSLATTGSVTLNKRYVLTKGVLVENQTGLVTNTVDSLSAEGKYLIFITQNSPSKVQDAFGADFMYHVLDTITLKPLDEESVKVIIHNNAEKLKRKAAENLHVYTKIGPETEEWVATHYDKTQGAEAISSMFYDFYVSLSHMVLNQNLGKDETITVTVKDDKPVAVYEDVTTVLSRSKNSEEEIEAINKEIDQIVGLEEVKSYIRSLQSHIAIQQKRKEQGMKTAALSMHMIFTGNPGTGKTTIARLISRYMKAIGALSQGQLVEVTRADLVAQYVGQTAPLTMSVIKSAIGGVIFIDEAYSLYRGKDDSFGLEAIDTLVKAMEDNRDDLIVILAGYKREMAGFLESNSGLKSRFPNLINFPDYTGEELRKIAVLQAKGKGYEIAEDVYEPLEAYFNEVQSINAAEAGNGRLARNVVEDAILSQANRLVRDPDASMTVLLKEDFDFTVKVKPPVKPASTNPLEDLLKMTQGS